MIIILNIIIILILLIQIHLPPMGLTPLRGRGLRSQEKLRKLSKPVYLQSHDEIS